MEGKKGYEAGYGDRGVVLRWLGNNGVCIQNAPGASAPMANKRTSSVNTCNRNANVWLERGCGMYDDRTHMAIDNNIVETCACVMHACKHNELRC